MKKIAFSSLFLALLSTNSFAGNFYLSPSIFGQRVAAPNSTFWGVRPHFAFGYGQLTPDYYLGGEVFSSPTVWATSDSHVSGALSAKITSSYGIDVMPGIIFEPQIIGYAIIGLVNSKFAGPGTTKNGGQLGLGVQTSLSQNWDVRAEYIFTAYKSISGLGSPRSNEIGVGLVYQIGRKYYPSD